MIFSTAQRNSGIDFLAARCITLFSGLLISMIMVLFVGSRFIHVYDYPIHSLIKSVFLTWTINGTEPCDSALDIDSRSKFLFWNSLFVDFLPKNFHA